MNLRNRSPRAGRALTLRRYRLRQRCAHQRHDGHGGPRDRVLVDLRVRGGRAGHPASTAFRAPNPGVPVVNAAVAGGAGSNAIVSLANRPGPAIRPTSGRPSPASRSRATRGAVRSATSRRSSRARACAARMHPTILRRSCGATSRTGSRPVRTAATSCGSTSGCSSRPVSGRRRADYTLTAFLADLERVKASGAVPGAGRAGPLHHRRAVRERAAQLDRGRRAGGTWSRTTSTGAATAVQPRCTSSARCSATADPDASGLTWDAGDEEARDRWLCVRVDERLGIRRADRGGREGGRALRGRAVPRHRGRASSRSSTSSWPRPRRRTPGTPSPSWAGSS